ncbi:response regulator transcription factor [Sulfurimonas sp. HSL3-7]|uniref:response regulator transcription factor n=1 Tax=Sulfonitrofixus jiaomeiensis TaxID=3131938 RepID=UPI0031FA4191
MRILLLEDELILKESIEEFLTSKKYIVDGFENSDDAFDAIFSTEYDLLLLDVNVPGEWNGFSLRKELAREGKSIPTIFVTSMSSADAMLQGYANGCCDYIKKPFDLIELLLRVQHALKSNCFKTKENFIELPQGYSYNVTTYELSCQSKRIPLSKREGELLNLFLIHRNQVVSFEMLYEQIWENNVDSANARVQVNNLRRKLPKNMIKNIYGLGYRLDCR